MSTPTLLSVWRQCQTTLAASGGHAYRSSERKTRRQLADVLGDEYHPDRSVAYHAQLLESRIDWQTT